MRFRPCIDLHRGVVKQIVGGTLSRDGETARATNFVSDQPPEHFAWLYRKDGLTGGHVIMLDRTSAGAAGRALAAWPGGLQIGGGITAANAGEWLERGAAAVIVTSYVFQDGEVAWEKLANLSRLVGKERLVLDLSCRRRDSHYYIVTNRWQTFTRTRISRESLAALAEFCSEFLIHAADVEGRCQGIEDELVERLAEWTPLPATYAGGVRDLEDVKKVDALGDGRLDLTVGSALDIFGGTGVRYADMVALNRRA